MTRVHLFSQLEKSLAAWPKIDLHRHLEGSLRLHTLAEIGRENGMDLPSVEPEELRPHVQVVDEPLDFYNFLGKFRLLRQFYADQDTIIRLAYESIEDAATDNVKYLELRFNPVALAKEKGFTYEEVTEWVITALERAQCDHDIQVRLIIQVGRDETLSVARRLAETAVAFRHQGVVALDLAGDEISYRATRFAPIFQWARSEGLHVTIHAGEAGPATNIREAIELLGAERIGHGVRAYEDSDLLELLRRDAVTLEMCPTSNLQTGTVVTFKQHPLLRYHQGGLRVTINTDDPGISNITLTDEYRVAVREIGISPEVLKQLILNAARGAFLPPEERQRLVDSFEQQLTTILKSDSPPGD